MTRLPAVWVTLLVVPSLARSQQPEPIKLTIHPAAVPMPALKNRLLPEERERTPGNAALLYYRAFAPEWTTQLRPEIKSKVEKWIENSRQVPENDLHWVRDSKMLREIDRAARREYCDWELLPRFRHDWMNTPLPDLNAFRTDVAPFLAMRARIEIADGQYEKALFTLQSGFSLNRHVADGPTMIHALMGCALAHSFCVQTEELIQAPNSPNLYWALTDLPRPFIGLRKSLEAHRIMMDTLLPGMREALAKPDAKPLTSEQARAMVDKLVPAWIAGEGLAEQKGLASKVALVWEKKHYAAARKFLLGHGHTVEQLKAMPALQAVLLHQLAEYDRLYDEFAKWHNFPYWEARAGLKHAEKQYLADRLNAVEQGASLTVMFLPRFTTNYRTTAHLDRRIAALRCVEAIRLHAAAHDAKLPARLDEIKGVPIPDDPFTGKAFAYKAEGDKATLEALSPDGEPPFIAVRYELRLKK